MVLICRICGECKADGEFKHITNFTKYKKHVVVWCRECQKAFVNMKKNEREKKDQPPPIFLVTFE